jgi:hypothetical protein
MGEKTSIVVTTINAPNHAMRELAKGASANDWNFIVIGDKKSPTNFRLNGATFFDFESQKAMNFKLAKLCPAAHYTRKNLGYLIAIERGSHTIIETDDDNIPTDMFWQPRNPNLDAITLSGEGWINIYSLYSEKSIWPRGLPLENILRNIFSPIQQGLADGDPDVDAVYRMTQPLPLQFSRREHAVWLSKGVWSPFNSQNTTWFKEAFPLLYLPSYCSFRMTDIWRSFVAQRVAWECDWGVSFHNASVYQERNEHNLLRDFELEIPGYLLNNKVRKVLEDTALGGGSKNITNNLLLCYEALVRENIITNAEELTLLNAWISDIGQID